MSQTLTQKQAASGKRERLRAMLRRDILSGKLRPGQALPTQQALSRRYGMREMTTHLAMSQLVSEGLVVSTRGRGSIVNPNPPRAVTTIDFVRVSDPGVPERPEVADQTAAASGVCESRGWRAAWHVLDFVTLKSPQPLLERFTNARGVVVYGAPLAFSDMLHAHGVPVVVIGPFDQVSTPLPYPRIERNRHAILSAVVDHLVDIGRRKIAFVTHTAGRELIFMDAVRRHRLGIPTDWIIVSRGQWFCDVTDRLRALWRNPREIDAFCCGSEYDAMVLQAHLLADGVRVPADVAIAACDTTSNVLSAPVPVTTVGVEHREFCARAIEEIERIKPGFDPREDAPSKPIMLPHKLVVRASTDLPKTGRRAL